MIDREEGMAQAQQTDKDAASADKSGNEAGDPKSRDQKSRPSARADEGETSQVNEVEQDPIAMLRSDHRKVEGLFGSFEKASSRQEKAQLTKQICTELMIHTLLEEELFYPACKRHMEERLLAEAQVEHDGAKTLIIELQSGSPDDPYYDAKVKVLSEDIKHHVAEEEKPNSGIFAKAKQANVSTADLAKQMGDRKRELTQKAKAGGLGSPEARSFRVRTNIGTSFFPKEDPMAGHSTSTMDRDYRGRFVSDDDDDRRTLRPRDDDYDDRRYDRPGDEEGRFTSSRSRSRDDDRRSRSSSRDDDDRRTSRSRDDDDDRRSGRDHGGWFGDRAGHAEAARRGWEEREGSTRSRYGDDRRTSRSRDDDYDDRRYDRPRDEEGRFTSSRSRSRDDDDDRRSGRGHGGWFGDPEGHAEAARHRRR
jgi:hemerythrin superfamily protein